MGGFDIRSILDFKPPRLICMSCRALLRVIGVSKSAGVPDLGRFPRCCEVCGFLYVNDPGIAAYVPVDTFLKDKGLTLVGDGDLLPHARNLARLVERGLGTRRLGDPWPTLRLLFEVLLQAKYFVHVTSWGMSETLVGALRMISFRVPVHGFVSNVSDRTRIELTEFPGEAPNLHIHAISNQSGAWDGPHQKLVIVDGLVAFQGSANLTTNSLRKADRGLDISEVVTDVDKIMMLNNKYFSPVWKRLQKSDETQVVMNLDEAPF